MESPPSDEDNGNKNACPSNFLDDMPLEEWFSSKKKATGNSKKRSGDGSTSWQAGGRTLRRLKEQYISEMPLELAKMMDLMDNDDHQTVEGATTQQKEPATRRPQGVMYHRLETGDLERVTPTASLWYCLYCRGQENGNSLMPGFDTKFRNRFRLPYENYLELATLCIEDSRNTDGYFHRWCPGKKTFAQQPCAPIELLLLTSLRYLGRGWTFDDLEESTAISAEVIRCFFHRFVAFGADVLFRQWVSIPSTLDSVRLTSAEYRIAGFPGCVGSMDATNIECDRISYKFRQDHLSFKMPFCCRSYNITTNHRRRIMSTTHGHPARWNDKTLVKFDSFATGLKEGKNCLKDLEFELYEYNAMDESVTTKKYMGAWLMVDNGYLNWAVTIPPMKIANTRAQLRFSKWLESMRKDVECTFGILKGRWRILKAGVRLSGTKTVDRVWKTCCALHNMLLDIDGVDEMWQSDWLGQLGETDPTDIPAPFQRLMAIGDSYDSSGMGNGLDQSFEEIPDDVHDESEPISDTPCTENGAIIVRTMKMADFRDKLVEHFDVAFKRNEIIWPAARMMERQVPSV